MKRIAHILIFICLSAAAFGQNKIDVAFGLLEDGQTAKAKAIMDDAVKEDPYKQSAEAWFWRGYITKELYKETEKGKLNSDLREQALTCFDEAEQLDLKKEFAAKIVKQVNYLANTFYTDVVNNVPNVATATDKSITRVDELFARYVKLKKKVGKNAETKDKVVKFERTIGYIYMQKYEKSEYKDMKAFANAERRFKNAMQRDSLDVLAVFHMGILHYNTGADILNKLDYDLPIDSLQDKIDEGVTKFLLALPYLHKAHALDKNRREVLKGLAQIYNGLGDLEKEEYYIKKLEALPGSD